MGEIDRYLNSVTYTRAVVGFLVEGSRICLGVRKRASNGLGLNLIAGIGGKIGDSAEIQDETASMAMDREANEEIGVKVLEKQDMGRVRFIFTHKPPESNWNQEVRIYSITRWEGKPCETESIKPLWFDIQKLPWEQMWEDNQYWLPRILSGERIEAVILYRDEDHVQECQFEEVSSVDNMYQ
jgi:8-oxo-dGTP pyrophosphatase MutT (NUDIX family)